MLFRSWRKLRPTTRKRWTPAGWTLWQAPFSALPFEDDHFDKIVTVESYYFWPALETDVREVRRVLKPGGHFLLVAEIYDHPGLPQSVLDNIAEYQMRNLSLDGFVDLFKIAGFADLSIHVEPEHQWICAEGIK